MMSFHKTTFYRYYSQKDKGQLVALVELKRGYHPSNIVIFCRRFRAKIGVELMG